MLIYSGKDDPQLEDSSKSGPVYEIRLPPEIKMISRYRAVLKPPFAYGLTDDPYSRSLGAWEGEE